MINSQCSFSGLPVASASGLYSIYICIQIQVQDSQDRTCTWVWVLPIMLVIGGHSLLPVGLLRGGHSGHWYGCSEGSGCTCATVLWGLLPQGKLQRTCLCTSSISSRGYHTTHSSKPNN